MPTAIQWTDETWNPTTGCTKVSRGCFRCYIDTTIAFRMAGRKFVRGKTDLQLHPDRLDKPLHWRKPRRVFVNSLSDLFHEGIPDEFIARVFETMRAAPTHTFQVLTKRPERALEWFSHCGDDEGMGWITHDGTPPGGAYSGTGIIVGDRDRWPLPNVWMGVSIEDSLVTWRADVLRQIPAAVRFISAEPLLGSLYEGRSDESLKAFLAAGRDPELHEREHPMVRRAMDDATLDELNARRKKPLDLSGIDWLIIGGESGPKARPFHLEHAREIIGRARVGYCGCPDYRGGVHEPTCTAPAVFVKQLGAKPVDSIALWHDANDRTARPLKLNDRKGGAIDEWPADLRIREFPTSALVAA